MDGTADGRQRLGLEKQLLKVIFRKAAPAPASNAVFALETVAASSRGCIPL